MYNLGKFVSKVFSLHRYQVHGIWCWVWGLFKYVVATLLVWKGLICDKPNPFIPVIFFVPNLPKAKGKTTFSCDIHFSYTQPVRPTYPHLLRDALISHFSHDTYLSFCIKWLKCYINALYEKEMTFKRSVNILFIS